MLIVTGIILFGLFVVSLVLPWVQGTHIQSLQKEVNRLTAQVDWLISHLSEKGEEVPKQFEKTLPSAPLKNEAESISEKKKPLEVPEESPLAGAPDAQIEVAKKKFEEPLFQKKFQFKDIKKSFEQRFVVSLPVWIGGIALALSGAFMVKYSIEMGFLSPSVRIIIGSLFGVALLLFGNWIHDRPNIANGKRISQALSGAGIADLYVCLFAATSFYHLIPPFMGFAGMAVVTAVAVILSLKQGPPIAMLGMIGGFLTPALIESREPNAQLLFVYLYFLLAGLFTVIRRKNWWFIAIPVVLAAFAWVIFWLETSYSPHDSIWLGIFLIAVSGTIVFHSKQAMEEHPELFSLFPTLNYLTIGGAVLLISILAAKSHFGEIEWGLFGFLTAGGIILSYYNQKLYGFVPWVSVIMNVILLLGWEELDPTLFGPTLLGFALLYSLSSYWLMWNVPNPRPWAMLAAGSSLIYYILAYGKFHHWFNGGVVSPQNWSTDPHFWGFLALGLFVLSVCVVVQVLNRFQGEENMKQLLLTIFTLTATAFLSIGLTIELKEEFLTIALCTEILAISWINGYVQIKALRPIAGFLALLFGILLIPKVIFQISLLSNIFAGFYMNNLAILALQKDIPSVNWSLFHLGLPALMFGTSSFLSRQEKDDFLTRAFEMTAIGLITVMTYYLIRHGFHINENLLFTKSTFIERGTLTNIFFLYGIGCLWWGRTFNRVGVSLSGIILIGLSLLRILFFDLLIYNPLLSHQQVGSLIVFNGLLLSFGLPMLWVVLADTQLTEIEKRKYFKYLNACLFALLLFFVSFNVRQIYHGQYLDTGITSNGEVYSYSAVWLLTGIGLLFFGTLKKNKTLRIASLAFLMLAIAKVFLYDASELTGLFRVFSFLGLGISLLGLSWFYTRFVFKRLD